MFKLDIDERLSSWSEFRSKLETCQNPLQSVMDFWKDAPYVPYNHHIDPYYQPSWPSPWEIIVHNKYDDFTKALMMAYSLKFTQKFDKSVIQVQTCLDIENDIYYNIVCIDDEWVLNYKDDRPILKGELPKSFSVENFVEVKSRR